MAPKNKNGTQTSLVDNTSATLNLPDGRQLGYAQYGSKDGAPIIHLHGCPGSRIDFARSDQAAKAAGARIIAIDRPGIGLSSPHKEATLLSFAKDVEYFADTLGLTNYAILGGSAGGAYSLACAYSLPPDKLKAAAVICGPGTSDMGGKGMKWMNYLGYRYGRYMPASVFRWHFKQDPGYNVHLSTEKHLELLRSVSAKATPHEREKGLFNTEESLQLWLKTSREAYKNGVDGPVQDAYRIAQDWGFRIEDIRKDLPVYLWYGKFDEVFPVNHGEQIAARIGKNARLHIKDETHGSMFANQPQEYLTELVNCMKEKADSMS